jgi:hypothetical protein
MGGIGKRDITGPILYLMLSIGAFNLIRNELDLSRFLVLAFDAMLTASRLANRQDEVLSRVVDGGDQAARG